jgi:hypothetical protein
MFRMQRRAAIAGAVIASLWIGAVATAQPGDPLIGTWELNLAKSKYANTPPKKQTVTFELAGDATRMISVIVGVDGKTIRREYTAKADGKDYPMNNFSGSDTVSLTRIDARTVQRTDKKDGKVTSIIIRQVSADGKTFTTTSKRPDGTTSGTVAVYDRVSGPTK